VHALIALPAVQAWHNCPTLQVLYADDSPWSREVTRQLLVSLRGVELHLVNNGVEAVQAVAEREFDLVLMDLAMSLLDGFLATARIRHFERANPLRRRVPVVGYCADPGAAADPRLTACGIDELLLKPCTAPEMSRCLLRWCIPAGVAPGC